MKVIGLSVRKTSQSEAKTIAGPKTLTFRGVRHPSGTLNVALLGVVSMLEDSRALSLGWSAGLCGKGLQSTGKGLYSIVAS